MTHSNRDRVTGTVGQEQRDQDGRKGKGELHRGKDRNWNRDRRTWTGTEGWKMESNRERGGRDRGIEDRYRYSYEIMAGDRWTVRGTGRWTGTEKQRQRVRDKGTGTGRGRDSDEHKHIDRDRGTWTEARAWTDRKRQKKYTGTQGQGQEQWANNGGTVTDRKMNIVMETERQWVAMVERRVGS